MTQLKNNQWYHDLVEKSTHKWEYSHNQLISLPCTCLMMIKTLSWTSLTRTNLGIELSIPSGVLLFRAKLFEARVAFSLLLSRFSLLNSTKQYNQAAQLIQVNPHVRKTAKGQWKLLRSHAPPFLMAQSPLVPYRLKRILLRDPRKVDWTLLKVWMTSRKNPLRFVLK